MCCYYPKLKVKMGRVHFFVGCDIVCFLPSSTREPENVAKMNTSFSIVRFSCSKPALSS